MQNQQIAGKYQLIKKIGAGAFGEIWQAICLQNKQIVAVKLEPVEAKPPQLLYEYKMYKLLIGGPGIPYAYHHSQEENHNAMVMEMLGPSLESLFALCGRIFSMKSTLMLADQMLTRLEYLHQKTFIHRDQKPDNYCIGRGRQKSIIYLIDFGLAKRFIVNKAHIPYKEHKALTGTVRYCSINTHLGIEQSRRDDLESLGYIFVYFAKGSLPWQGLRVLNKKQKYEKILEKKLSVSVEQLCRGLPQEFTNYLQYTKSLRFDDPPDYGYLKKLFSQVMNRENYTPDCYFDWNHYGYDLDGHFETKKTDDSGLGSNKSAGSNVVRSYGVVEFDMDFKF
ncbi:Kinase [Hexamita inflata]|uniref:Kinase n=1 Tax=Hexamita inflata TaxID=28002 RepID=A0AA86QY11_9EUKA|nr:CK1 Casein kinase [Hexamita inflata]CAI9966263.1 CK1 Casein kinase [Hexamita inflata]